MYREKSFEHESLKRGNAGIIQVIFEEQIENIKRPIEKFKGQEEI